MRDMQYRSDDDTNGHNGLHGQYLSDQIQVAGSSRPRTEVDTATEGSTVSSASTFTQLLRDYSIRFWDPLICCKLRKRTPRLTFGIDGLVNPSLDQERFSLLLKPVHSSSWKSAGHWVDKVTLKTTRLSGQVFTPKIPVGFLRLQLMVCLGPRGVTDLAWRCSTRWSRSSRPSFLKRSIRLKSLGVEALPNLEIRPHIKCDMFSPEMSGRVGGAADVERGHAHISVPRLHFRYEIDRQSPPATDRGAGSNAEDKWVDDTVQGLVPTSPLWRSIPSADVIPLKRRRRFCL